MTNCFSQFISTMRNIKPLTSWSFSEIMIVWNHNKELKIKDVEDIAYLKACEEKGVCPESGLHLYLCDYDVTQESCGDASCICGVN